MSVQSRELAKVTVAEAAIAERAKRELARRRLIAFAEYVAPWYRAARHHRLIAEYLELVETFIRTKGRTGVGRLMIFMPPRHGKSEEASRLFPAWLLGRLPDSRIILTSYGADLAMKNSRGVRNYVMDERYQAIFGKRSTMETPVELSSDSRSVESWDLAAPYRGGVVAAGVGGAITGMGAHLLVVDDPFKNREEAESQAHRDRVWDWWLSSAYTRLEDGGAIVLMMTRWHADDLAGRLLKAMATNDLADRWVVVCLPALAEERINEGQVNDEMGERRWLMEGLWPPEEDPLGRKAGEALWREKYSEDDLARTKENVGRYDWSALYQQRPYSRHGNMFKREWFTIVDEMPGPEHIIARLRYWDKAATEEAGAYTVGTLMALADNGMVYVEHVVRGQWSTFNREDEIKRTARLDVQRAGPAVVYWMEQEGGSGGKDSVQMTMQALVREVPGLAVQCETVTGSKEVRALPWATACEAGVVRLVRGGWNEEFIEEHVAFPKGRYKDQVDSAARGYVKLMEYSATGGIWV